MTNKQRIPRLTPKGQGHAAGSLAAAITGQATGVSIAPGHPFIEATGSGIKWTPETLELWLRGERLDVAEVETATVQDCWRDLAFVGAFPTVTHWWFSSSWTQRVRATQTAKRLDGARIVWLQAVQEDADELPWVVLENGSASGPLPEYTGGAANVALQARLGHLASLVLVGQIAIGQWAVVTSLVATAELPALLRGDRGTELLRAVELV